MNWERAHRALCPKPARHPAYGRALNIGVRTVHLAATGILLGGHAFAAPAAGLKPMLWMVVASGTGLLAIETYKSCDWIHEGWGLMLILKLGLLCLVPLLWELRLPLLLAAVALASVESHMPARFRHYSFFYHRVMKT
jgi:hypothetical protein